MILNEIEIIVNMLLAAAGGIVRELTSNEVNKSLYKFIAEAFIGIFCGITVYFFLYNTVPQNILVGLVALSGYLGVPVLEYLRRILKTYLEKLAK